MFSIMMVGEAVPNLRSISLAGTIDKNMSFMFEAIVTSYTG
jgi:hypothetical protein